MGGKNAIIVDEDADLDEAVKGVIYSAFGYAGQKCSACSRVIAVGSAYEPFMNRLSDAVADIQIGAASDPSVLVGPVISAEARDRIATTINEAEKRTKLAYKGKAPAEGFFVGPTVFRDVPTDSPIWTDEIFGPVVACRQAANFNEAIKLAVDSEYALTGGVFSRSPSNIAKARAEFKVGNLYINRGCTGAMVCRQPFGGFAMSGVGSKAGGPDYLVQFMEPRTVSENTMRRGFAPELPS
jgi:RHH-type proline utilization regulon transcriptional repressor/proline dehydrogenase/delta 1-pyrroline-5-carboxylate dehydrogenase